MPKKLVVIIVIIISFYIIFSLFKQIFNALDAGKRLDKQADEVSQLQDKNRSLRTKLNEVEQPEYIEKIARDKLNLSKPDETTVIIPDEEVQKFILSQKPKEVVIIPNWQGWLNLFVH
jgi:cell division protein FtsB